MTDENYFVVSQENPQMQPFVPPKPVQMPNNSTSQPVINPPQPLFPLQPYELYDRRTPLKVAGVSLIISSIIAFIFNWNITYSYQGSTNKSSSSINSNYGTMETIATALTNLHSSILTISIGMFIAGIALLIYRGAKNIY